MCAVQGPVFLGMAREQLGFQPSSACSPGSCVPISGGHEDSDHKGQWAGIVRHPPVLALWPLWPGHPCTVSCTHCTGWTPDPIGARSILIQSTCLTSFPSLSSPLPRARSDTHNYATTSLPCPRPAGSQGGPSPSHVRSAKADGVWNSMQQL